MSTGGSYYRVVHGDCALCIFKLIILLIFTNFHPFGLFWTLSNVGAIYDLLCRLEPFWGSNTLWYNVNLVISSVTSVSIKSGWSSVRYISCVTEKAAFVWYCSKILNGKDLYTFEESLRHHSKQKFNQFIFIYNFIIYLHLTSYLVYMKYARWFYWADRSNAI